MCKNQLAANENCALNQENNLIITTGVSSAGIVRQNHRLCHCETGTYLLNDANTDSGEI